MRTLSPKFRTALFNASVRAGRMAFPPMANLENVGKPPAAPRVASRIQPGTTPPPKRRMK